MRTRIRHNRTAGLSSDLRSGRKDFALHTLGPNDAHHRLHARFRVSPCDVQGRDSQHHEMAQLQQCNMLHSNDATWRALPQEF
jgi:hypothetical protein